MIIQIEGVNRTEFCRPKTKGTDRRRFFETRGMMYRAYPEQLTRMRMFEFGQETGTDEVIVYQENSIHPQVEKGTRITRDKILADIDENKSMTSGIGGSKRAWGSLTSKHGISTWNIIVYAIVGCVLLFALLNDGVI